MSTPVSGLQPYLSASGMIDRFDVGTLSDLLMDTRSRAMPYDLTDATSVPGKRMLAILAEASGWVEAACLRGEHYRTEDLQILTGNSLALLQGLVARIAMFLLWDRRPARHAQMPLPSGTELAFKQLEMLEDGKRIFGLQEIMNASKTQTPYFMQPSDYLRRNFSTEQAIRYFGTRANQHVPGE